MKNLIRGLCYFLAAFLPSWVAEAAAITAGDLSPLAWSILVAKSAIPGIAAVLAFNDRSVGRTKANP